MRSFFRVSSLFGYLIPCLLLLSCGVDAIKHTPDSAKKAEMVVRPERDSTDTTFRIYLTFDDGPYTCTPALSQLLDKKGIRISFFIIGSQIDRSPWHDSVYKTVANHPNFKVYNHTHSHAVTKGRIHGYYRNPMGVWQDIVKNKSYLPEGVAITRLPGKNTWRTPSRTSRTDKQAAPLLRLLDSMKQPEFIVGWDADWNEEAGASQDNVQKLIQQIEDKLAKAPPHHRDVVILSHDYLFRNPATLELLNGFIDHFQQRGDVKFDWVQNLPGLEVGAAHSTATK